MGSWLSTYNQSNDFIVWDLLGQGGYGTVYSVRDTRNGREVAIKVVPVLQDSNESENVQRQISIQLHKLDHANIVKYHDCWEQEFSCLPVEIQRDVMQSVRGHDIEKIFCSQMNLYDNSLRYWLDERNAKFFADKRNQNAIIPIRNEGRKGFTKEDLREVLKYFKQILDAVEYYQSLDPPVMHQNLKPENILYEKRSDSFLISDFGLGRVYSDSRSLTSGIGTSLYAAPEQLDQRHCTITVDYYPLGIIMFEMLFPLQERERNSLRAKLELVRGEGTATAYEAMYDSLPQLCSLITKMTSSAESRPALSQIIQVIGSEIMNMGLVSDQFNFFELEERLGNGGFGTVYRFEDRRNDQKVAIKIVPVSQDSNELESIQREISIQLHKLDHENIVKYHDCWEQEFTCLPVEIRLDLMALVRRRNIKSVFCFKMNLYDNSLRYWLDERNAKFFADEKNQNAIIPIRNERRKGFTKEDLREVLKYFKQILDAVEYYQSLKPPVMHRDLKPGNILYDKSNDSFLISDFGLGRVYSDSRSFTSRIGTELYAAPEQLDQGHYDINVDYYPLGIILFEMLFPLQGKGRIPLREKLELFKKGDTATACEAMYHSLPQLCSLITKMISSAKLRPALIQINQVIGSEMMSMNLFSNLKHWFDKRNAKFFADERNQNAIIPIRNEGRKGFTKEDLREVLKYFKQILDAVKYYQSLDPPVMHCGLKPESILYDESNDSFLISDFGIGRVYSDSRSLTSRIGTELYAAPEQLDQRRYTIDVNINVDYYPLGIILFEMLFPLQKEERNSLGEKLELLKKGDTATACEAMYHSLPQLCSLITKMISSAKLRPALSQIIQVIGSEIMNMGLVCDQFHLFEMGERFGHRGLNTVYGFKETRTNKEVAIKIIPIIRDPQDQEMVRQKISIQYHELDHKNIVKYHDCWEQEFTCLPIEIRLDLMALVRRRNIKSVFCFKMNLYNSSLRYWLVQRNGKFFADERNQNAIIPIRNEGRKGFTKEDLREVLKYFKQILDAVKYYQSLDPPVIHPDLKPGNILYDKSNDSFLISDFGLGRVYSDSRSLTDGIGTRLYAAPEQLDQRRYDINVDYYPLGIILFEMLFPLQEEERNSLGEKLELLKKGDTTTACEAMYHSLPQLCILITEMISSAESRPSLSQIIQVIGSEIMNMGLVCDQFHLFEMVERVGHGGFNTVYGFKETRTNKEVAIKIIPIIYDPQDQEIVRQKISIQYYKLDHTNIVKYHDCWEQEFSFLPVEIRRDLMDLVRRRNIKTVFCFKRNLYDSSLRYWLDERNAKFFADKRNQNAIIPIRNERRKGFTKGDLREVLKYFKQILDAVEYYQSLDPPVMHCGLKPKSILYDESNDSFLISDFGLEHVYSNSLSLIGGIGTRLYAAPEQLDQRRYTIDVNINVDYYPLGIILFEMLFPLQEREEFLEEKLELLKNGDTATACEAMYHHSLPQLCSLITRMTSSAESRPALNEIIQVIGSEMMNMGLVSD